MAAVAWFQRSMPARVGIVGCGDISRAYAEHLAASSEVVLSRCADLDMPRAEELAGRWGLQASTVEALIGADDVDLVLNLTPPTAHARVSGDALRQGKHVYSEKPLATTLPDAQMLVGLAAANGLHLAGAPDTFLAEKFRAAAWLIDEGAIGQVVGASAAGMYDPPEIWHPDPRFLYQPGAGPLFDMGPYFLHVLFALLGPVARVAAVARTPVGRRRIGSGPLAGVEFDVNTPTHVAAVLEMAAGPSATLQITFDAVASTLPMIEIQGTAGTLVLSDPEAFDGGLRRYTSGSDWTDVPLDPAPEHRSRGAGVVDLVGRARQGLAPLVSPDLALHAVDVMTSILTAAERNEVVTLRTSCRSAGRDGYPRPPSS